MENKESLSYRAIFSGLMLDQVPSYANKIFYSMGFLSMTSLCIIVLSGIVMVFFGPDWWLKTGVGVFVRSLHLWAVQAFIFFILLHLLVVFFTSGFRLPRRLTWILGSLMFFLALAEAEFGYVLRNDFSSQWRSLQGADLYNGSGLGKFINNLNYAQIYGIHIVVIPLLLFGLLFLHYLFVKTRGIAKPFKKDVAYRMVKANHRVLFLRGVVLSVIIFVLAVVFPAPIIAPVTIRSIAARDPSLIAHTLVSELNHTSDTATYFDTIDPYRFNTKQVYIDIPYAQYITMEGVPDILSVFNREGRQLQEQQIKQAKDYFSHSPSVNTDVVRSSNPVVSVVATLVSMARSGLYEAALTNESQSSYDPTYATRFLADTGVLDRQAEKLGITTEQYGMLREGKGLLPPGAWWLAPLGVLDHTVLANDDNQDRDGALILGCLVLLLMAVPYIPYLNRLPEKLGLDRLIWKDDKA